MTVEIDQMNVPAKIEKPMLLEFMADKYGLKPQEFANTVRATCGMPKASAEEFAAFMMVCKEYDLNPILREVYAFPKQGGGIVPIVGIDGWLNLINKQPMCDGFEFDVHHSDSGELIAMTCRMYRKDRAHPVEVTEYLSECIRQTAPWKMAHRMLRHKVLMQAGRYAFGFSGIYDDDDARAIAAAEAVDITPPQRPTPPKPPAKSLSQPIQPAKGLGVEPPVSSVQTMPRPQTHAGLTPPTPPKPPLKRAKDLPPEAAPPYAEPEPENPAIYDPETGEVNDVDLTPVELLASLEEMLATAKNEVEVEEIWDGHDVEARLEGVENGDKFMALAFRTKAKHLKRVGG
jgi:hypothetical protein